MWLRIDISHHIHHEYYLKHSSPWQVPDSCLVTLCKNCHDKRHLEEGIPWYDIVNGNLVVISGCDRCGGSGNIKDYKHIQGGICFKCNGNWYTNKEIFKIIHERIKKK